MIRKFSNIGPHHQVSSMLFCLKNRLFASAYINPVITIYIHDILARCERKAHIASCGKPGVFLADHSNFTAFQSIFSQYLAACVCRSIINAYYFYVLVCLVNLAIQALPQIWLNVIYRNYYTYLRRFLHLYLPICAKYSATLILAKS